MHFFTPLSINRIMSVNKPRFTDQLNIDLNNIIRGITTKKSEAYISKLVKMFIKRSHGTDLEVKLPENTRCFVVGDGGALMVASKEDEAVSV